MPTHFVCNKTEILLIIIFITNADLLWLTAWWIHIYFFQKSIFNKVISVCVPNWSLLLSRPHSTHISTFFFLSWRDLYFLQAAHSSSLKRTIFLTVIGSRNAKHFIVLKNTAPSISLQQGWSDVLLWHMWGWSCLLALCAVVNTHCPSLVSCPPCQSQSKAQKYDSLESLLFFTTEVTVADEYQTCL